jgi:hypothetical protein
LVDGKEVHYKSLNFDHLKRVVIKANKNFKEIQVQR